jgi:putative nucleotidyltransferase with HDIG domain
MDAHIPGWTPEIERGFKEILFRFLEEIQSTRAALYLFGPEDKFLLATQYGFGRRDVLAIEHGIEDAMVRRVRSLRDGPATFNIKDDLGSLTNYIKSAGNSELLLAPLFLGDEIIGFVDARDKGRRRPFERSDVAKAKKIADAMVDFARRSGFLGPQHPIDVNVTPTPAPRQRPSTAGPARPPMFDESGLETIQNAAIDCVLERQVVAVAVSLATAKSAATLISIREGGAEVDREALLNHQTAALADAGVAAPGREAWQVETRRVSTAAEVVRSPTIASSVLLADPVAGSLTASVISGAGAAGARATLGRLRSRAADARETSALRFARRNLARRLLQPGVQSYPDLVSHSEAVSKLAFSIARLMDLKTSQVEDAALAGLLHDVGMRELDYERLYRNHTPTVDDRMKYQKHPVVGEQIVAGTGLDDVAAAIRHHHERWDGTGYPDRLAGTEIPLLARLVHVAEVYDVLTVPGRYRPTVSAERALEIIERGRGHQFDPRAVDALGEVVA